MALMGHHTAVSISKKLSQLQRKFLPEEGPINDFVTKNCCVTYVKIREYANFISNLLVYLISVASQCIFSFFTSAAVNSLIL